jgi:O-succinylbenzoic acid--CoA ligase
MEIVVEGRSVCPEEQIESKCAAFAADHIISCGHEPTLDNVIDILAALRLGKPVLPTAPHQKHIEGKAPSVATLLWTSGTAAEPKLAAHTWDNHRSSAEAMIEALQLTPHSRTLLALPLHHVGGLASVFRTLLSGGTLLLSTKPLAEALTLYQPTHLSLVPTQLHRIKHLSSFPSLLVGGAPLPDGMGLPLRLSYGMTEMSSTIALDGRLLPGRELKLVEGEIWVRGQMLFAGYWDSERNSLTRPLEDGGWFATRDLGHFDAEGKLVITGRKDRQFLSGGENIQPEEIEAALCRIPGIRRAHIQPTPDPEWGARPIAFVEDTEGRSLEALRAALTPWLPRWKHPTQLFPYPTERLK